MKTFTPSLRFVVIGILVVFPFLTGFSFYGIWHEEAIALRLAMIRIFEVLTAALLLVVIYGIRVKKLPSNSYWTPTVLAAVVGGLYLAKEPTWILMVSCAGYLDVLWLTIDLAWFRSQKMPTCEHQS